MRKEGRKEKRLQEVREEWRGNKGRRKDVGKLGEDGNEGRVREIIEGE